MMKKIKYDKRKFMIKLISILFAFILWSYVKTEVNAYQSKNFRNVNVSYTNLDTLKEKNLVLMSPQEYSTTVTVGGYQSDLRGFNENNIAVSVDLSKAQEGDHSLPIKVTSLDSRIKIEDFEPKVLPLKIDKKIEENFKIDLIVTGKPKTGYTIGSINNDLTVVVSGANSVISKIQKIEARIDVTNITSSTLLKSTLTAYDANGIVVDNINFNPSNIEIDVPILKNKTVPIKLVFDEKSIEDIDVSNFTIEPSSVTIRGKSNAIDSIKAIYTNPIDINDIKNNGEVSLNIPKNVEITDPDLKFSIETINK